MEFVSYSGETRGSRGSGSFCKYSPPTALHVFGTGTEAGRKFAVRSKAASCVDHWIDQDLSGELRTASMD